MVQEVYIIDDDDSSILVFRELFKNDPEYKFINIKSEQIDVALKNIPSLIIINEDAVDRDVVELCKQIRTDEDNTITPVIVVSSNSEKSHRVKILQEAIEYFIKKPVDEEYLYYTIKNLNRLLTINRRISPLTGLPGNVQIHAELKKRIYMIVINALDDKGLTQERLQEFVSNVNDEDIEIYKDYNNKQLNCKKENLVKDFFTVIANVQENDILTFQTSSITLHFFGKDLLWWTKTNKRLEKLESIFLSKPIEKKERKKKEVISIEDKQYSVGIATVVDNALTNIHHFSGTKAECIDFINNDMFERYIDETLKAKVVINLAFDEDEFNKIFSDVSSKEEKDAYKKNLEMWYTIQELEEMGAISTK